ncbi:MAG: pentapeptide repeat-containing protein [Deltaproteobacteria bacterium]|nr:pentapeptide repeat-containing protein [Deltaproteobacteria bacterium]
MRGTVVSQGDLQGIHLVQADLRGANFEGSNLKTANLRCVDARGVVFRGADLHFSIISEYRRSPSKAPIGKKDYICFGLRQSVIGTSRLLGTSALKNFTFSDGAWL